MKNNKLQVRLERWENGIWWLVNNSNDEPIDGDRRKYVVLNMVKRWNYKIVEVIDRWKK